MGRFKGTYPLIVVRKHISGEDWKNYKVETTEVEMKEYIRIGHSYEVRHEWEFEPSEHEDICCQTFGCGNVLTMRELLFGNKCSRCQK